MGLKTSITNFERCVICGKLQWHMAVVHGAHRVVLCIPHFKEVFPDKKPGDLLPDNGDYPSNYMILVRKFISNEGFSAPYDGPVPWEESNVRMV